MLNPPYIPMASLTGEPLETLEWLPDTPPKGVVQLVHGMAEHIGRYDWAARQLAAAGYAVVGHSHLGHGHTATQLGWFAPRDGWRALIEDVHALRQRTQSKYPDAPYFILGHSMGSFVTRNYCLLHEDGLAGVILSGTGHFTPSIVGFAGAVARAQCALGMARKPSRLIEKLSSSGNNRGYDDVQTPFDWLSRDREQVRRYIDDPLCGFTFTASAYRDMFTLLSHLYPEKLTAMKPDIPIYMFSGDADPVGARSEGVRRVADELRAAGVRDVRLKLYAGGRHEMFNELNRDEVIADLAAWLDEVTAGGAR